jgi:hypothetical protein
MDEHENRLRRAHGLVDTLRERVAALDGGGRDELAGRLLRDPSYLEALERLLGETGRS